MLPVASPSQAAHADGLQLSISEDGLKSLIPQPAPREFWNGRGVYSVLLGRMRF